MRKTGMAGNPALTYLSASDVRPVTQAIEVGQCNAHERPPSLTAFGTFRLHWPEYLMEASLLGAFMVSASVFCVLLEYPHSPVRLAIAGPAVRRFLMGISMGLTAVAIIYSPWGRQSGAHINPSVSLAFLRLGKIQLWDATFYIVAQFAGASWGMLSVAPFLRTELADPAVLYVVTVPGIQGTWVALLAEFVLSFGMMYAVLHLSGHQRLSRYTGVIVGVSACNFRYFRSALLRYEHQSGQNFCISNHRTCLDGILDLCSRAHVGHASRCRILSVEQRPVRCEVLQTPPREYKALCLLRSQRRIPIVSAKHYDVIIIGTGAGGGTLAYHLASSGKRILILERGDYVPREKDNWNPQAVNIDAKYNTKESWLDKDGRELHPHTNYYVGGNTKFVRRYQLRCAALTVRKR